MRSVFKYFPLLFLFAGASFSGHAQQLADATRQCWSGGVAGRHGCNYNFSVFFPRSQSGAVPERVWIDGQMIELAIKQTANSAGNMKKMTTKKGVQYDIAVGTHFNDQTIYPDAMEQVQPRKVQAPCQYTGIALIGYRAGDKMKYFEVKKIFNELPHISYP